MALSKKKESAPVAPKEVQVIEKKLSPVLARAAELEIVDEKTMEEATTLLSNINRYADSADAEKQKTLRPALDTVNAIRAQWKPIETVCEKAIALIRGKMTKYQTAAKAKADEEAAKIASRVGEGKGKLTVETAVRKIDAIDKPAAAVATNAGMVKFKTVKKFEVEDKTKLPMEFLIADEVAIRKAMLAGRELPGVRYFEEQVPLNFR